MMSDNGHPTDGPRKDGERTLTQKTVSGSLWTVLGAVARVFIRLAVLAVLARLVTPADFGVFAAALLVLGFAEIFSQLGVSQAIIQRQTLQKAHIGTGFLFTIFTACIFFAALYFSSSRIADAFGIPDVQPAVELLAIIFPIKGLGITSEALLLRWMQFRRLAIISLASYALAYAPVAILMAFNGWGVTALISGQITQTALVSALFLFYSRHSFSLTASRQALKDLLGFGGGMSLAKLGSYISTSVDNFIVGRTLGSEALGLYSRAFNFMMMPTDLIGTVLDKVVYSAMSEAQDNIERIRNAYRRSIALIAMLTVPASVLMIILGPEIVRLALGGQWTAAIIPFQILSAFLPFRAGYKTSAIVAHAQGAVYRSAMRQWMLAVVMASGAWVGHFWGVNGVAVCVGAALVIQFLIMLDFGRRLTGLALTEVGKIYLRYAIVAAIMGVFTLGCVELLRRYHTPDIATLFAGLGAAGLSMMAIYLATPKLFGTDGVWVMSQAETYVRPLIKKDGLRS